MLRDVLLLAIKGYRVVSSALPPRCRFFPSCSAYTAEAIERYGASKGVWLALKRLVRCHPWNHGGHDPVPPTRSSLSFTGVST